MQWKCRGGPETIFIEECVRYRRGGSWSIFYGESTSYFIVQRKKKIEN